MRESLNQIRRLSIALMMSGGLNLIFIVILFYWVGKEGNVPYWERKTALLNQEHQTPLPLDHTNSQVVRYFRKLTFEQLKTRLKNVELVEDGYTQRDLALASLVAFHHFDLPRALSLPNSATLQKRRLAYGKYKDGRNAEIAVYPALSEQQYKDIQQFVMTEKCPLTSKGLFLAIKKGNESLNIKDASLYDAFLMTPEFLSVEILFARCSAEVSKKELLNLILEGDWNLISNFGQQQTLLHDLSPARRQRFLLDYLKRGSSAAAQLLLKCDAEFALHKLDDEGVAKILQLLNEKSIESEQFAIKLLVSPRSDMVWKLAAEKLYFYAGETPPEKYHHHAALSRFVPQHSLVISDPTNEASKKEDIQVQVKPVAPQKLIEEPKTSLAGSIPTQTSAPSLTQLKTSNDLKTYSLPKETQKKVLTSLEKGKRNQKESLYIVQEGDSLWKISRRFNIDVEYLKTHNRLNSDFLKPGEPLRIPERFRYSR